MTDATELPAENASSTTGLLSQLEIAVRRDPAQRGLLSRDGDDLVPGHLPAAVDHLARFARQVWLITGFYVPKGDPPSAETDGPPGAAFLAAALAACGVETRILTDQLCLSAVACSARTYGLSPVQVLALPGAPEEQAAWCRQTADHPTNPLTHVVCIERVGPAHTPGTWSQRHQRAAFADRVPREHWNACHNMRGEIIDPYTWPLHQVVEWVAAERPGVRTIGVGDGGNELGMGAIPYTELRRRLFEPAASRIPCRIATDWTILAGVSNWGAMALAAGFCLLRGRLDVLAPWDRRQEERRLKELVEQGPAVDGVTRLPQVTVDGLPFLTYLQPWERMRVLLGLEDLMVEGTSG